jgi:LmbE family N-acetylglucosaminyl deacetylase
MQHVLVVSAHLDDAVFSCWSVISDEALDVSVLTVFTAAKPGVQSTWDGAVDSEVRAEERRAEDRAALALAGRMPIHLPFFDREFGPTDPSHLAEALASHIEEADVVYAPLAIAHHDHVLVRHAVRQVRPRPVLYVDYPYALTAPKIAPLMPAPGLLEAYDARDVVLPERVVQQKLEACRCYEGELVRIRQAGFPDFVTAESLGRETFFEARPLD